MDTRTNQQFHLESEPTSIVFDRKNKQTLLEKQDLDNGNSTSTCGSITLLDHPISSILQAELQTTDNLGFGRSTTDLSSISQSNLSSLLTLEKTQTAPQTAPVARKLTCNRQLFLCPPKFLELKYVINPWMDLSAEFSVERALRQWEELVELYQKLVPESVFTVPAKENLTELCFLGDSVFAYKNKAVFGRFATTERFPETQYVIDYFMQNGIQGERVPEGMHFEGSGETMVWNGKILVGYGKRNSAKIVEYLSKQFDVPVIGFNLIDPEFYHLDTAMFPISDNLIAVYENAFSEESKQAIRDLGCEIMYLTYKDAKEFALNSTVIDRHVIVHYEAENFIRQLQERGFTVHRVDVSEFIKFGGGLKCLTFQHYLS